MKVNPSSLNSNLSYIDRMYGASMGDRENEIGYRIIHCCKESELLSLPQLVISVSIFSVLMLIIHPYKATVAFDSILKRHVAWCYCMTLLERHTATVNKPIRSFEKTASF